MFLIHYIFIQALIFKTWYIQFYEYTKSYMFDNVTNRTYRIYQLNCLINYIVYQALFFYLACVLIILGERIQYSFSDYLYSFSVNILKSFHTVYKLE